MATKYILTIPIILEGVILQVENQVSLVEHTVYSKEHAQRIVDEILMHRNTGHKSAYLYHLEYALNGKFKQTSNSVIYIDEVTTNRIRTEGGAHDLLKKIKNSTLNSKE